MIQRIQSLFFLFSAISCIVIVYFFPVLQDDSISYLLKEHFIYARFFVFSSAALSLFSIFQFKDRKRQHLIASFSRLMITISVLLIIFLYKEDKMFGLGMILLVIPFILLLLANVFIKKDDKLVSSADRIR
tara:strand:+ start:1562 stop:1954 length:393 start_codon:yes stop_codon:yes gene_type:complete